MIFILRISRYEISIRKNNLKFNLVDKPKPFFKILNHDFSVKIYRLKNERNSPRYLLRLAGYKRPESEIARELNCHPFSVTNEFRGYYENAFIREYIAQKVNRPVDQIFPKNKQRVY